MIASVWRNLILIYKIDPGAKSLKRLAEYRASSNIVSIDSDGDLLAISQADGKGKLTVFRLDDSGLSEIAIVNGND